MSASSSKGPKVLIYPPPTIEVYQVTDDELRRIEEATSNVDYRFSTMLAMVSAILSIVIALTQGEFGAMAEIAFKAAIGVLGIVAIVMGWKWWRGRSLTSRLMSGIRARRIEPDTSSDDQP